MAKVKVKCMTPGHVVGIGVGPCEAEIDEVIYKTLKARGANIILLEKTEEVKEEVAEEPAPAPKTAKKSSVAKKEKVEEVKEEVAEEVAEEPAPESTEESELTKKDLQELEEADLEAILGDEVSRPVNYGKKWLIKKILELQ